MATDTVYIRLRFKHWWLLKLINYPLGLLGCRRPYMPGCCYSVEGPFADKEVE
jgi:hypothetical protein